MDFFAAAAAIAIGVNFSHDMFARLRIKQFDEATV